MSCERLDRLHAHRIFHEPIRRRPEQHLTGAGRLLQSSRDVHRVAGHESLADTLIASHDLAGVHADADADVDAVVGAEFLVQSIERPLHALGRSHGAERVVLVQPRDPEDGHDGVADVLLHHAAVLLDHRGHRIEIARLDATECLRIEPFADRR